MIRTLGAVINDPFHSVTAAVGKVVDPRLTISHFAATTQQNLILICRL